jgi:ribosomal protein S18 acetylase RimI-like enzyme
MGHPGEPPSDLPSPRPRAFGYVPIRSLSPRHKPRALAHLLALEAGDRHLRFGYAAADEQIRRYVERIDFDRDEVFGVFNRRLQLVALAHLAYEPSTDGPAGRVSAAEFGVSVAVGARGRGYGSRLFDHAMLRARNRGVDTLVIHALTENVAMLKIVRRAGAQVESVGNDAEAWLRLPPESAISHVEALVEQRVGELDYQFKEGAQLAGERIDGLLREGHPPGA